MFQMMKIEKKISRFVFNMLLILCTKMNEQMQQRCSVCTDCIQKNDDGKIDALLEKLVAISNSRSYMDPFPLEKNQIGIGLPPPPLRLIKIIHWTPPPQHTHKHKPAHLKKINKKFWIRTWKMNDTKCCHSSRNIVYHTVAVLIYVSFFHCLPIFVR